MQRTVNPQVVGSNPTLPANMDKVIKKECPKHGLTDYALRKDGRYRCRKCASESVSNRRRIIKLKLVEYKGGKCELMHCNFIIRIHLKRTYRLVEKLNLLKR